MATFVTLQFKVTPTKSYADAAKAAMEAAAKGALKSDTDFQITPAGKSGYGILITLAEILITDKSVTCNFTGLVSDPAGYGFGPLSGHSATAPTKDEAGDVAFVIKDAVPKMMAKAMPAIKNALTTNPGRGIANPVGGPPNASPPKPPAAPRSPHAHGAR